MKILFVVEHYHPYIGGAEKLHQSVAEALVKKGHSVTVITTRFDAELKKEETIGGVKIKRIPLKNRYLFTFLGWLWMFSHTRNADLIQTASYNAALPAYIVAKLTQTPIVVTFHEVWQKLWSQLPYLKRYERILFSAYEQFLLQLNFTHWIAVSDHTQKCLIENGVAAEKITRIYNGVDYKEFERFSHEPTATFSPLYFARLGPSKGLNLLLPAWKIFLQNYPNQVLTLVIPTYPKGIYHQVKAQVNSLELEKSVRFEHELSFRELMQQIAHASVVIIPSYAEGFCFAAVETSAIQTPILSSHQGALKETVSGKVIQLEELSVEQLTQGLKRAYNQDFDWVPTKRFEISAQVEKYVELYQSLVRSFK